MRFIAILASALCLHAQTAADCSRTLNLVSPATAQVAKNGVLLVAGTGYTLSGNVVTPKQCATGDLFLASDSKGVTETWFCPAPAPPVAVPMLRDGRINGLHIATVTGGTSVDLVLTFSGPAPDGGVPVSVRTTRPEIASIGPVVLAAGSSVGRYPIALSAVQSPTYVTLLISAGSVYMQLGLTVTPAEVQPAELTIEDLKKHAASRVTLIEDAPATWSEQRKACAAMVPGDNTSGGSMGAFVPWSMASEYRRTVTADPVASQSRTWLSAIGADQGSALRGTAPWSVTDNWNEVRYGIPYIIVDAKTLKVPVRQDLAAVPEIAALHPEAYPDSSDPGPFPIPMPPAIQGTVNAGGAINYIRGGDKHVFVLDKDKCFLHESWNTFYADGQLFAGTIATFDLLGGDHQRPWGWSSSSVSGAPQFAGLATYEEVASGRITHALAFTGMGPWGRAAFTGAAAHHQWSNTNNPALPPFGARIRLRADFDISSFGPQARVILKALQEFGAIYVDGGLNGDLYYSYDNRWNWLDMGKLFQVKLAEFEFLEPGPIYSFRAGEPRPPAGSAPVIRSIEAYPTKVKSGQPAIVFWELEGESMRFLSTVGALRENYAIVYPAETTTYKLVAQNKDGRVTSTVTVTVE